MTFEEKIDQYYDGIRKLLIAKHNDYGEDNLEKFGVLGIFIRICDKTARLENLLMNRANKMLVDEPVEDTVKDLMGYLFQLGIRLEGYDGEKEVRTRLLLDQDFRKANYTD